MEIKLMYGKYLNYTCKLLGVETKWFYSDKKKRKLCINVLNQNEK